MQNYRGNKYKKYNRGSKPLSINPFEIPQRMPYPINTHNRGSNTLYNEHFGIRQNSFILRLTFASKVAMLPGALYWLRQVPRLTRRFQLRAKRQGVAPLHRQGSLRSIVRALFLLFSCYLVLCFLSCGVSSETRTYRQFKKSAELNF